MNRAKCRYLTDGTVLALLLMLPTSGSAADIANPDGGTGPCAAINGPICVGADSNCQYSNLQDAIDAAPTEPTQNTTIHVARNQDYTYQHLSIQGRNVTLVGGYASCGAFTSSGTTVLDGKNSNNLSINSVVRISASSHREVGLRNLELRGGGPAPFQSLNGGGVYIGGNVAVDIQDSSITHNNATRGGGLYVDGSDGAMSTMTGTDIIANTVSILSGSGDGGGIYCTGGGQIDMSDGQILGNVAEAGAGGTDASRGGGVFLDGCEFDVTAGGGQTGVRINLANRGGGVFLTHGALLQAHGTAQSALPLSANIAGADGGGIYAEENSLADLDGAAVDDNTAGNAGSGYGGGIYSINSTVLMDSTVCRACSSLSGNVAEGGTGSAIWGDGEYPGTNTATIFRTIIEENLSTGGQIIRMAGLASPSGSTAQNHFTLSDSLVIGNTSSPLALVTSDVETVVNSTTIADNDTSVVFSNDFQDQRARFFNSIVHEAPGTIIASGPNPGNGELQAECLMLNAGNGLPADMSRLVADPMFVDAASDDYHLQPQSRAIDFCGPSEEVPDIDLDGNARGLDAPQVPPFLPGATNDLGAYEWTDDVIFSNGFDID